jgi:nickel-dependent lactate racemase
MIYKTDKNVAGTGAPEADLRHADFRSIIEKALSNVSPNAKVLAIISDKTRDDNTPELFPITAEILAEKNIAILDALVAQGTHSAMSETEKLAKIGAKSLAEIPNLQNIFDHDWSDPEKLIVIGELPAEKVREVTKNLFNEPIELSINKLLAPGNYDVVLIFGATVPHEVAGFAGGAKYFFPGVAGAELTHATHWLAALATIENIIGRIETPTRHLIEAAADFMSAEVISFTSVVSRTAENRLQTHALFAGDFRLALRRAAEISRRVHIKYTHRKYKRVVALLDEHYEELWLGGKASYRLGAVVEEAGELIIYAPHLHCISETHGAAIERFGGYAPLETVKELVAQSGELQANLCVAAHLTQVAYAGRTDENGELKSRYQITLASQVDENTCRRVKLGFMNFQTFRLADYENDADTLIVERAGRDLYLVAPNDD